MPETGQSAGCDSFVQWFGALGGQWRLIREISDGSRFVGDAVFSKIGEADFLLREEGKFFPAGQAGLAAGRRWIWRLDETGLFEIRYPSPDGRLYHRFEPASDDGAWCGEAGHLCGDDNYAATYRLGIGEMEIVHHVSGPAKHYRLMSRFTRSAAGRN